MQTQIALLGSALCGTKQGNNSVGYRIGHSYGFGTGLLRLSGKRRAGNQLEATEIVTAGKRRANRMADINRFAYF